MPHGSVTSLAAVREERRSRAIQVAMEDALSKLEEIGRCAELGLLRRLAESYRGELTVIFRDETPTAQRVAALMAICAELTWLGTCMNTYFREP